MFADLASVTHFRTTLCGFFCPGLPGGSVQPMTSAWLNVADARLKVCNGHCVSLWALRQEGWAMPTNSLQRPRSCYKCFFFVGNVVGSSPLPATKYFGECA
eukprot:gnl/MRDRNA2_/MRDRNA2_86031_c0_seq6.p1 gnl/MRDRNA2_/MRDRNA2_86031_c0~~gnl/MRDRNA2_/MRDRNA2_86031_c0_seq6.p1  ORF type:complete len:101 (+),score=2.24 gnl/MRDRNA2_/MRDRNA2_86031_c0_seq6:139-441(+)